MKKLGFLGLLIGLSLLLLQNCKHEIPENPNPTSPTPVTLSDTCSLDTVYFVNDVLPIIISNCALSGCHDENSRQDGVQLTDYDNIINTGGIEKFDANSSELYDVITETDPSKVMPPSGSLSPEFQNAIRIWINQGAKNNECFNVCDTTDVTFSGIVWPILLSTCNGCHRPGNLQGGVSITNYSDVKTLVDSGTLQNVLARTGPKSPMPPQGPLEDCAMDQIRIWIEDGAKDN
ncbi:MAG: hypothetical protein JJ975_12400 [Bacteroidia bacterium]|nr:hypothetical protein [Bacteroidia bacterium]